MKDDKHVSLCHWLILLMLLCHNRAAIKHGSLLNVSLSSVTAVCQCCFYVMQGQILPLISNQWLLWVRLLGQLLLFPASLCITCHYEVCSLSSSSITIWLLWSNVPMWPLWRHWSWFWAKYAANVTSSSLFYALTGKTKSFTNVAGADWKCKQTKKAIQTQINKEINHSKNWALASCG